MNCKLLTKGAVIIRLHNDYKVYKETLRHGLVPHFHISTIWDVVVYYVVFTPRYTLRRVIYVIMALKCSPVLRPLAISIVYVICSLLKRATKNNSRKTETNYFELLMCIAKLLILIIRHTASIARVFVYFR